MELEGVEPSSSRGTGAVSTCVVSGWFLCGDRPGRPTAALASKDFAGVQRRGPGYFRSVSEKGQSGDVSSLQLLRG